MGDPLPRFDQVIRSRSYCYVWPMTQFALAVQMRRLRRVVDVGRKPGFGAATVDSSG
ncbi:MAG: hypothetical protein OXP09_18535 [Gammaproteobacteria bacterium]|nr:hypothetical protein [Gammaproteobacteria bacterium]